jgi:CheY-like chemotaxis protein
LRRKGLAVKRILVIEDEEDVREITKLSLENADDWEVQTARSGPEGIALAGAARPDAILLDVMMPGMDGPATLQQLQSTADTRHIPVILFTAKSQSAEVRRFTQLGAAAVITKPFDPMKLAGQVARALGWRI